MRAAAGDPRAAAPGVAREQVAGMAREQVAGMAREHLMAELDLLATRLRREIARLRAARILADDQFRGLYISDDHVDALLAPDRNAESLDVFDEEIERLRSDIDARWPAGDECPSPVRRLAEAFALDRLSLDAIVAAAAVDVDLRFSTLFSYAQNDVTRRRPSVDLILRLSVGDEDERLLARAAFAPGAPLLRHRLLHVVEDPHDRDPPSPARALALEESVLSTLLGEPRIDERLDPHVSLVRACRQPDDLVMTEELRASIRPYVEGHVREGFVVLSGPEGTGRRRIAEAAAAAVGRGLLAADCASLLRASCPIEEALVLLARDAVLHDAVVLLRWFETVPAHEHAETALDGLEQLAASAPLVFVATETEWSPPYRWRGPPPALVPVPAPPLGLRGAVWERVLGAVLDGRRGSVDVDRLASTFSLTPGQVEAVAGVARAATTRSSEGLTTATLEEAVRATSSEGLRRLAQRVPHVYGRDDIVLPSRVSSQLDEICRAYRHRATVYGTWGFHRARPTGAGLKVLFAGPSGTGKSMAAQIVARELGLDLYAVDISTIVDKYIGETEKHLRALFAEARKVNCALLFDEADALFGKRSQVQDAHDRYANIEVGFLLQQLESFDGVAILATNLRANIDDAFMRRLDTVADFPAPDGPHRERIWRKLIPDRAPLDADADLAFLGERFELAGGNIRNCVLTAAFAAADEGVPIAMRHLVMAVAGEYQKIGKLPSRSDFGDFFEMLRHTSTAGPR